MKKIQKIIILSWLLLPINSFAATKLYGPNNSKTNQSKQLGIRTQNSDYIAIKRENQLMKGTITALKKKLNETIIENSMLKSTQKPDSTIEHEKCLQEIELKEKLIADLKTANSELKKFKNEEKVKLETKLLQNEILIENQEKAINSLNIKIDDLLKNIDTHEEN